MDSGLGLKSGVYGQVLLVAIGLFLAAAVLHLIDQAGRRRAVRIAGEALFALGSTVMGGLWVYRWVTVGHVPLQTMFEIFLTMGLAIYPLSAFCRFVLGARLAFLDALMGMLFAFPAAVVNAPAFSAAPRDLPPALQSWLFGPHVAVYMLAYVVLLMAAFHAVVALALGVVAGRGLGRPDADLLADLDRVTYRKVRFGFPLLTLGLVLGSIWGKLAWGDYWNWDPKEMYSLATWFAYLGYFHFRYMFPGRYRLINALWVIGGGVLIVLTLLMTILPKLSTGVGLHMYAS